MNTKKIEAMGVEAFKNYLSDNYSDREVEICDIRNSKQKKYELKLGCDLIVRLDGEELFIELKASKLSSLPTNIRFTHQTIASMHKAGLLAKMIVVYVYNLSKGLKNAKFKFFIFGNFTPEQILVEPHFIIQPKQIIKKCNEDESECPITDSFDLILKQEPPDQKIEKLFKTQVSKHMKL